MGLAIGPETKVGALLEAYPGIEDMLIAEVPAFSKLRNPILRRTVAKVATLEQAARIGGIAVRELVLKLRAAVGQDGPLLEETYAAPPGPANEWVENASVARHLDADALLAAGEHPLGRVRRELLNLPDGQALRLTSSFRPAPLLDALDKAEFRTHLQQVGPASFATYIQRVR